MPLSVATLLFGAVALYFGANWLIKGSSGLARNFGVTPAIIGLTVVAFGTSLPELVVSLTAALKGNADIALGNIVGSNIANIGLILGIGSSIRAITVERSLTRREAPMGIVAALILTVLSLDGRIGRIDGCLLLVGFAAFLYWSIGVERTPSDIAAEVSDEISESKNKIANIGLACAGLAGVLLGGNFLVDGGIQIAEVLGVPAVIIGLTMVAVGTSIPELVTFLVASAKGEDDISVGNVLGSNLFNVLFVLGIAATVDPIEVPQTFFKFQYPALVVFSAALLPMCRSGLGLSRREGAVLLCAYISYIAILYFVPALR